MRPLVIFILLLTALTACGGDKTLDTLIQAATQAEWRGDYAAARQHYGQAAQDYPESATAWAALGEHLRFYAHDAAGAEAAFIRALNAPQYDAEAAAFAWRGLGELAANANREEDAALLFDISLRAKPLGDTYRSLCHFHVTHRDWEAAAQSAQRAVALAPNDPIALLLYAAQLERAGRSVEGQRQQARAYELAGLDADGRARGPVHCCVYYNAAGYFAVRGDQARALQHLAAFFATPNHRHLSRGQIVDDPDFTALKSTPEFVALLAAHLPEK